ncbi:MAG TPA: RIP metalloprotease RseP [Verrucomicrobiae bacterium]|nr:RIP metalloprotease RseP [Verrucomicrobiae bacterium]
MSNRKDVLGLPTALASIFVFGLLIFGHELGHYVVARLAGVRILEFAMGMGPKLIGTKRGDTLYTLRLLPLGGYVKMAGMDPEEGEEELAPASDSGSFMNKTVLQRMAIIFAGPLMNFLLALVLFVAVFTYIGVPVESDSNVIGGVMKDKPAYNAGLQPKDKVVAINGSPTPRWEDLTKTIHASDGKELTITIERDGEKKDIKITPKYDAQSKRYLIGIGADQVFAKKGTFEAATFGLQRTLDFTKLIITSIFQMITGKIPADVGGPVAIVNAIGEGASQGFANLLGLTGMLSIQLGLLNLFPIPALDGSRLVFLAFEGLRGKPLDPAKENFIHLVGFALLILLMIVITYNDILRLLGAKAG